MPELIRFGGISLRVYADDHHPPHFHIVSPDFQVLVRISDLAVVEGIARVNQLAEALAWARENHDVIARKWAELNERS